MNLRRLTILVADLLILCLSSSICVKNNPGWPRQATANTIPLIEIDPAVPMSNALWQYLRTGLSYLEASGKNYPPNFPHAGGKAYGPLGLSPIAVKDVLQHYADLSQFSLKDVFSRPDIYEEFAKNYSDLLLKHYLKIDYQSIPKNEVFAILQRAWFLGPTQYKKGNTALLSREKKAKRYILENTAIITPPATFVKTF